LAINTSYYKFPKPGNRLAVSATNLIYIHLHVKTANESSTMILVIGRICFFTIILPLRGKLQKTYHIIYLQWWFTSAGEDAL